MWQDNAQRAALVSFPVGDGGILVVQSALSALAATAPPAPCV
jgi:hypothetical protein